MTFHGDRKREYDRAWIKARRDSYFEGTVCAKCGAVDNLELDHKDPLSKIYNPAALWGMNADNPKRTIELAKCQILCEQCHQDKSIEEMPITQGWVPYEHGTRSSYNKRGCRCGTCKDWNNERVRKQRASIISL